MCRGAVRYEGIPEKCRIVTLLFSLFIWIDKPIAGGHSFENCSELTTRGGWTPSLSANFIWKMNRSGGRTWLLTNGLLKMGWESFSPSSANLWLLSEMYITLGYELSIAG